MKHPEGESEPPRRPSSQVDPESLQALEHAYHTAIRLGFLGPQEAARLRERHLEDALGLADIRRPQAGERWVDLGSGAGLPGLPLALAYPATAFTLVDAQRRRLDWVAAAAADLGLDNVTVVHARLEEYGQGPDRASFDAATARALAPLPVVAELGMPLLRLGGRLLVPRGKPADEELDQAARALQELGGTIDGVVPNLSSPIDHVGFVVIMAKIAATSPRFPRRSGVPARTPLGQRRRQ